MSFEPDTAEHIIQSSPRYQRHFCRECGQIFENEPGKTGSPHASEYIHRYQHHPNARTEYATCSRYCSARAQHEEVRAGRRMYGKGVEIAHPTTKYDSVFPKEKD